MKKLLFTVFALFQVVLVMAQNPIGSGAENGSRLRQQGQPFNQPSGIRNFNDVRRPEGPAMQINQGNSMEMHFSIINVPTGTKAAQPIVIHYEK